MQSTWPLGGAAARRSRPAHFGLVVSTAQREFSAIAKDTMTSPRRMGPENAPTRLALLDAAERVLRKDGSAALSSSRVAEEAGLKQQIVYYYFRTMDDLVLATFRRRTERALERLRVVLASDRPLHALWKLNADAHTARLSAEFMALANRNEAVREEVASYLKESRAMQTELLARLLKAARIDAQACPPAVASILIPCIAQYLDREESMGVTDGHTELRAVVASWLGVLEPSEPSDERS